MPALSQEELVALLGEEYRSRIPKSLQQPLLTHDVEKAPDMPEDDARGVTAVNPRPSSRDAHIYYESIQKRLSPESVPRRQLSDQFLSLPYGQSIPRNSWTEEQRRTLAFMRHMFANKPKELTDIFNFLFSKELRACGLKNGLSSNALISQWADMKAGREGYSFFRHFNIESPKWNRDLTDLKERIQIAAQTLGITLDIRVVKDANISTHGHLQKKRKAPNDQDQNLTSCSSDESIILSDESVPEVRRVRSSRQIKIPKIAFRFFNFKSQGVNSHSLFVAGSFVDSGREIPPPQPESKEFKEAFRSHMDGDSTPSPFISTFSSAMPSVHRALCAKNGAGVSVIDLEGLADEVVFSAGQLVAKYGFTKRAGNPLRGNYTATTEFHVWGRIRRENIIATFSLDRLMEIAQSDPEIARLLRLEQIAAMPYMAHRMKRRFGETSPYLDETTGNALGRLLFHLSIPAKSLRTCAKTFAYSWRLHRTSILPKQSDARLQSNEAYQNFISGVETAYAELGSDINRQPSIVLASDQVDVLNPYDAPIDLECDVRSQCYEDKVASFLAGMADAAAEGQNFEDPMDVGAEVEVDKDVEEIEHPTTHQDQLSPLHRRAIRNGWKYRRNRRTYVDETPRILTRY